MASMKYHFLYKSGKEETIVIEDATPEELLAVDKIIAISFRDDKSAILTFDEGKTKGYFIRLNDVSRVTNEIIEE